MEYHKSIIILRRWRDQRITIGKVRLRQIILFFLSALNSLRIKILVKTYKQRIKAIKFIGMKNEILNEKLWPAIPDWKPKSSSLKKFTIKDMINRPNATNDVINVELIFLLSLWFIW